MMGRDAAGWLPCDEGSSIGETGSDGGVILRDDEYGGGARITLERGGFAAFSITCGLYGWMVHTRFFSTQADAEHEYAAMQPALAALVDIIPLAGDPDADEKRDAVQTALSGFVDRFP
ncbi:MAG TPA: hypothetical protein VEX86_15605 [Longimicrobium sp.]|nr:hypothetical protein [Longimicrobium sp.]